MAICFDIVYQRSQTVQCGFGASNIEKRGMYRVPAVYRVVSRCTGLCRVWLIFGMKILRKIEKKIN